MNREQFFAFLRKRDIPLFGTSLSADQVAGLEAILDAVAEKNVTYAAYILATAHHETAGQMQPIKETVMPWHKNKNPSDEEVIRRLDKAWADGRLGRVSKPYWRRDKNGKAWFGRGLVQITFRENYQRIGARIGVDLVSDPDLALDLGVAVNVLVTGMTEGLFTGKKLSDYLPGDYRNARRIVNGTDRADDVARAARMFEAALMFADVADEPVSLPPTAIPVQPRPKPIPLDRKPAPAPKPPVPAPAKDSATKPASGTGIVMLILAALAAGAAWIFNLIGG